MRNYGNYQALSKRNRAQRASDAAKEKREAESYRGKWRNSDPIVKKVNNPDDSTPVKRPDQNVKDSAIQMTPQMVSYTQLLKKNQKLTR